MTSDFDFMKIKLTFLTEILHLKGIEIGKRKSRSPGSGTLTQSAWSYLEERSLLDPEERRGF